jgi:hypothetical protein
MLRVIAGLVLAVALLGGGLALASGLTVDGQVLQAGEDDDLRCDEDGVSLSFNVQWNSSQNRYDVTGFTITGIDQPDCAFKRFIIRLLWSPNPPYSDLEYIIATNGNTSLTQGTPSRPAEALIGWRIVIYDEAP